MKYDLRSKRVLVTGGSRGIGKSIVEYALQAGAEVVALSKTQANLDKLKEEYPQVEVVACDLSDWNGTRAAVEKIGHVDCLVNNAGFIQMDSFLDMKPESFDEIFSINVKSMINVSQIVVKRMIELGTPGSIVNVSSKASTSVVPGFLAYGASKSALDMTSRVMAKELGKHQIRVNCVNPTLILTDMSRGSLASDPAKVEFIRQQIPLGKLPEVEDVANAVMFLLSDESFMISGIVLPIDGGGM